MEIPEFGNKQELFDFLVENKERIMTHKKSIMKHADAVSFSPVHSKDNTTIKENAPVQDIGDNLTVKVVINTTNLLDSHQDVHIPGLWDKSLQENKMLMHLQEHKMQFDKIISDGADLKAFTKTFSWGDLGQSFKGRTQALIFESLVKRDRNEFMLEQYGKGFVKNHSVGMRYVKLVLCINDPNRGAEFEAWEKYFPQVANQEAAEELGFFWAVTEAKVAEGSAVPLGSNTVTPTLDNDLKFEPSTGTQKGAAHGTPGTPNNNALIINLI